MNDMTAAPVQGTAPLSTAIDTGGAPLGVGGGVPSLTEPKPVDTKPDAKPEKGAKPEDAGDTLRGELARIRDEEAKEADKAKEKGEAAAKDAKAKADEAEKAEKGTKEEKPAKGRDETGKFAKATDEAKGDKGAPEKAATGQGEADKSRQSEGQKYHEPPARFLPEARTKWANVPNEVKAEVHRVSQEYEGEIAKTKEVTARYEPIRQFDEIAKANGRELKDSLAKLVRVEQQIARNPIAGLQAILHEIGPRKADGSALSLYEVAQYIVEKGPQQFQQSVAQNQNVQQQRQPDPEVVALKKQVEQLVTERHADQITPLITAFAAPRADFNDLWPQMENIILSGVLEKNYGTGLSAEQKLAEAYRMAGGTHSPSRPDTATVQTHSDVKPVPSDDAGAKSIRGAPNGQDPDEDDDETDIRKLLKREARKLAS